MRRLLSLLCACLLVATVVPAPASAAEPAAETLYYGVFRLVRVTPGEPTRPEITVPPGYELMPGPNHSAASKAEFYAYVRGPRGTAVELSARWPGPWISDVISSKSHLKVTHDPTDPSRVTFPLPVTLTSANQATLQVWSYPSPDTASGIHWRIEHNDPNRAVGYWATTAWPATQAAAAINYLVATEAVLQDSGLAAEARRRGHFFSLMGFETNNLLHLDNPPHWHLAYYPGLTYGAAKAHVPHFWLDASGRTFYNGMDIQGQGRSRFYAGDPAPIHDAEGTLIVTLTIRTDGGLDIDPPNGPRYSITAADGDFSHQLIVLRDGLPWRWVQSADHVTAGILVTQVGSLEQEHYHQTVVYQYDRLTGVITNTWRS